jgi:uncharacterized protein (TIGR00159 family)
VALELVSLLSALKELLSWRSGVDILLLASGLFLLYRTFIRLGTWKIATGILVAVGVFLAARVLELRAIEWVFGNFSQVAVIALIVIFQPELRKLFERASSMRSAQTRDPGDILSRLIAYSLFTLAKEKRGALVVFPGRESIQEWVSGGYALDARPSIPLLRSIFDPHSPGHDGALIVEKGRFSRLGVRLPVSQSQQLSDEYGTRHHAAMGLAEKSDALTVLVSEERGQVSLFTKGEMRPLTHADELVNAIVHHWRETAAFPFALPGGHAGREMTSQMLASLALAIVLWTTLIISQGERMEKMITVPVEFTGTPSSLVLDGDNGKEVRLRLSGSRSDLDRIDASHLGARIDLANAVPGEQTFLITTENINLPRGIDLIEVIPASVDLTLAELSEKQLAITPQLVGKLRNGLTIQSVTVEPPTVKALVPAGRSQEKSVMTTPVYLDGLSGGGLIYCKIIAPPGVQPAEKRWPDVAVRITVAP